jgi:REP element-mobilizing transposase RayT
VDVDPVLNRGNRRGTVLCKSYAYKAILSRLAEAKNGIGAKKFSFCLMPNHCHFVLEQTHENTLSQFMQ